VVGKAALPGNWQNFLRIDSNKTELFSFLSKIRRSVRKTSKLSSPLGRGCSARIHDILVKDISVTDTLVMDISVTGHFGNRTFW